MLTIKMLRRPHLLIVPCPAQGHVAPLLKLSQRIASKGIKVTFVNTEFIHRKIMASTSGKEREQIGITLVSVPDGLEPDDDARKDFLKFSDSFRRVMPGSLTELIEKTNSSNYDEPITCLLGDISIGWILDVAEQFGLEQVGFWPGGAAHLALSLNIPKIIDAGMVDSNGRETCSVFRYLHFYDTDVLKKLRAALEFHFFWQEILSEMKRLAFQMEYRLGAAGSLHGVFQVMQKQRRPYLNVV